MGRAIWTLCVNLAINLQRHCYQKARRPLSSTILCSSRAWDLNASKVFQLSTLSIYLFIHINAYRVTKLSTRSRRAVRRGLKALLIHSHNLMYSVQEIHVGMAMLTNEVHSNKGRARSKKANALSAMNPSRRLRDSN